MAVAPLFDFTVPAPHTASFTNGELALSVANPIGSAPARSRFFLSRWFDFTGGVYTLKCITKDAALWLVSNGQGNARSILNVVPDEGVLITEVYIPAGRFRIDIILSNVSIAVGSAYVAFSLFQDNRPVYVSTGLGWRFDTSPIPSASLPALGDPRLALPLFSVRPNWANGVTERLDFKTEILPSESDTEQRRSIRRFPRRSFEASFSRHDVRRARLNNFITGVGSNEVLVPLWHEQFRVNVELTNVVNFPAGTLALREYKVGDLVWVNNGDPAVSEIMTVSSINLTLDRVAFTSTPTSIWPAGSIVTPLRVARLLDPPQMDNLSDRVGMVQVRFSLKDTESWPDASWGGPAFFRFPINRAVPVNTSYDRPTANVLDNDFGPVDVTDIYATTRVSLRCAVTLRGRDNLIAFRRFIGMARGRAVRFWMPSMTQDLLPVGDFSGSFVDMKDAGLAEYVQRDQDASSMVAVVFKDGRPNVYRRIDYVQRGFGVERVYFTAPLPSIALADVERLMFVMPARFDQDGFEIQHLVDDSAISQTQVVVKSSEIDGMPAIE